MIKRIVKNEYILSISNKLIVCLFGIASSILLNRFLGPAVKGEFAGFLAITGIAATVLDLGIYQAYPYYKKHFGEPVFRNFSDVVILQFILYLAFSVIAAVFVRGAANKLAVILVPTIVFGVQLSNIALAEDISFRIKVNFVSTLTNLLLTAAVFLFLKKGKDASVPIILLLIKQMIIIGMFMKRFNMRRAIKNMDWAFTAKVLRFGFYPMLTMLLLTLNYKTGILALKYHAVSSASIGLYSTGVALSEYMWIIPDAFRDVMFNRTAKGNPVEQLLLVLKVTFFVGLAGVAGAALFGRQVIVLLYGVEFAPAYKVTVVLFAGIISMIYFKIIGTLFLSNGKRHIYFYTLLCSVTLNVVLNFFLIPRFEIMGTAIATAVSYTVMGTVFSVLFARMYNIRFYRLFIMNKSDFLTVYGSIANLIRRKD